jgi:hypothetical protein
MSENSEDLVQPLLALGRRCGLLPGGSAQHLLVDREEYAVVDLPPDEASARSVGHVGIFAVEKERVGLGDHLPLVELELT